MEDLDKKIIAVMQDDIPLVSQPYEGIAKSLGITEEELLFRLKTYHRDGIIRKSGIVLRHRLIGFAANALCAWIIPRHSLDEVGNIMAAQPEVTHCYCRQSQPDWPYNFYLMVHASTRAQCRQLITRLAELIGIHDYIVLYSTREWKKVSMRYFAEKGIEK